MFPEGDFKNWKLGNEKLGNEKLSGEQRQRQRFGRAGRAVPQGESGMEGEAVAAQTAGFFPLVVVYIGDPGGGSVVGDNNHPGCPACKCRTCTGAEHVGGDISNVYTIGDADAHEHADGNMHGDADADGDINSIAYAHSDAHPDSILDSNADGDANADADPDSISHGNIFACFDANGSLEVWCGLTHFLTISQDGDCH